MSLVRALRQAGVVLASRPRACGLPLPAGARCISSFASSVLPVSPQRDDQERPTASALGRHLMTGDTRALRGFATGVNLIGETSSGLPPTVHTLKYPSSEIQYDEKMHPRFAPGGDESKRAFTYMVLTGGRFIYASAIRLVILKFLLSMSASKDVLALASLEVDLSAIEVGQTITVKWRGKPVFIRRRSDAEIADANAVQASSLRDPQTDEERAVKPEWLVLVGVCTHLGCVPLSNAGDYNGWFCPCHGSHYDVSGRIRKGPAPYNLEVPQYKFLADDKLLVG
mmetsp:Transcript_12264/g.31411  ORF Transcript_12264/g.31411 Transcript_12264/m.31411 type:complete len:283 (-) Transcript_12264:99-947(-)